MNMNHIILTYYKLQLHTAQGTNGFGLHRIKKKIVITSLCFWFSAKFIISFAGTEKVYVPKRQFGW